MIQRYHRHNLVRRTSLTITTARMKIKHVNGKVNNNRIAQLNVSH